MSRAACEVVRKKASTRQRQREKSAMGRLSLALWFTRHRVGAPLSRPLRQGGNSRVSARHPFSLAYSLSSAIQPRLHLPLLSRNGQSYSTSNLLAWQRVHDEPDYDGCSAISPGASFQSTPENRNTELARTAEDSFGFGRSLREVICFAI